MNGQRELILERVGNITRAGVIEDGKLCGYYMSQGVRGALTGNVYVGMVRNVLPGMNAAFVDIGLNKNAYLPIEDNKKSEIKAGQMILCIVTKEPGGSKGPRISTEITFPGKLCAITPGVRYAGVSKKLEDPETRDRLYGIAKRLCDETGIGVIVRTSAETETEEALEEDYYRTVELWRKIEREAKICRSPQLIHSDNDLMMYAARELTDEDTTRIHADGTALAEEMRERLRSIAPKFEDKVEAWTGDIPLFDVMRIDHRLSEALSRQVRLKSGATIVIDETEAMTVIDVNTGKFTGKKAQEETILQTNLEAAKEIARQMRLRELGGIIMIDFIDLQSAADREKVMECLRESVKGDKSRVTVVDMTPLGLVEVTRKKARMPLSKRMLNQCHKCKGEGKELKKHEKALACAREIVRRRRAGDTTKYSVAADKDIIAAVKDILQDTAGEIEYAETNTNEWQLKLTTN